MKKIGITGPIGSGKSHVCEIFKNKYNIPVFSSDVVVKELQNSNPKLRQEIVKWLGDETYNDNGLNKPYIANILFNDPKALERMVALIRGPLMKEFYEFCYYHEFLSDDKPPYILFESAILMERNLYNVFDGVILVCADKEVRMKRVNKTRGMTRDKFESRNKKQSGCDEIKRILSKSFIPFSIIDNDNDENLNSQIELVNISYGKQKKG